MKNCIEVATKYYLSQIKSPLKLELSTGVDECGSILELMTWLSLAGLSIRFYAHEDAEYDQYFHGEEFEIKQITSTEGLMFYKVAEVGHCVYYNKKFVYSPTTDGLLEVIDRKLFTINVDYILEIVVC